MKEQKLVKRSVIDRNDYVVPYVEIYVVESCKLLAGSRVLGDHEQAEEGNDELEAKLLDISFSDVWEK